MNVYELKDSKGINPNMTVTCINEEEVKRVMKEVVEGYDMYRRWGSLIIDAGNSLNDGIPFNK